MNGVVEVKDVVRSSAPAGIAAHGIDHPCRGHVGDEYAITVAGWVIGASHRALEVEILAGGRLVKTTYIDIVRPDVAVVDPVLSRGATGYWARVGVLGLPPRFELEVRAVLDDGSRVTLGHAIVEHAPVDAGSSPLFRPIMVTSLGRMGTTWLLHLLSGHPAIVAHRSYPYELSVGRLWAHQLRVLAAPADYVSSHTPDTFAGDLWNVGPNPFYGEMVRKSPELQRWLGRSHVDELASFARRTIDGFYAELARLQGQDPDGYFIEKFLPDHLPILMWEMYPRARELFLVRDIRDVICSMIAFNAKRGTRSFRRDEAADDRDFVTLVAQDLEILRDNWEQRSDCAQLVRYEDLVRAPHQVLSRILRYLELEDDPMTVDRMVRRAAEPSPDLDGHKTSVGPAESIGRWRCDLAPALVAECDRHMAGLLAAFGYEASAA